MTKSSIRPPDEVIVNDPFKTKSITSEESSVKSAIRPPDEVIINDPFAKSAESEVSENKTSVSLSVKWLIIAISIAIGLEFISWIIPTGNNYTLLWYPLLVSINCINFAAFFIYCCYEYKLNMYFKIAGLGYLALNFLSIIGVLLPFITVSSIIGISNAIITIGTVIVLVVACVKFIVDISIDD